MVTMKMLFTNKGISLVVLLIAMTLISVLGASFVSLMSSKQKSFLHQIDSYRALNLANAGVEYAIRFASDGTDTYGNSIFFTNQGLTMTRNFGQGAFDLTYRYSINIDDDVLTATGSYRNSARRVVSLSRFRRYLSPLTLVPNATTLPYRNSTQVVIPVINNNESPFLTVNVINLAANTSGVYLQQILLGPTIVFDFNTSSFPTCSAPPTPPCQDAAGILLPNGALVSFNAGNGLNAHTMVRDDIVNYYLLFSDTAPSGQYIFKPTAVTPAVESTIVFSLL
jgi:hypothetical protein